MRKLVNNVYMDMTEEEILANESERDLKAEKEAEIEDLKQELSDSDYKAIKYAEGWYTDEEYAPIKAQRQEIRNTINQLESEVI